MDEVVIYYKFSNVNRLPKGGSNHLGNNAFTHQNEESRYLVGFPHEIYLGEITDEGQNFAGDRVGMLQNIV
jgi:hypothetical protein